MYRDTFKINGSSARRDSLMLEKIIVEVANREGTIADLTAIGESVVEMLIDREYIEEVE